MLAMHEVEAPRSRRMGAPNLDGEGSKQNGMHQVATRLGANQDTSLPFAGSTRMPTTGIEAIDQVFDEYCIHEAVMTCDWIEGDEEGGDPGTGAEGACGAGPVGTQGGHGGQGGQGGGSN